MSFFQYTFASRVIRKGEEITHIYQAHYGDTPRYCSVYRTVNAFVRQMPA
jgi:hypothetical protein